MLWRVQLAWQGKATPARRLVDKRRLWLVNIKLGWLRAGEGDGEGRHLDATPSSRQLINGSGDKGAADHRRRGMFTDM